MISAKIKAEKIKLKENGVSFFARGHQRDLTGHRFHIPNFVCVLLEIKGLESEIVRQRSLNYEIAELMRFDLFANIVEGNPRGTFDVPQVFTTLDFDISERFLAVFVFHVGLGL